MVKFSSMKRAILALSSFNVFSIKVEALYCSWLMTHSFLPFLIERRTPQRHLHLLLKFSSFVCFVWAVNVDVCTSQTVVTLAIIITILHSRHCDVSRLVNLNLSPAPNTFFPRDSIIKTLIVSALPLSLEFTRQSHKIDYRSFSMELFRLWRVRSSTWSCLC